MMDATCAPSTKGQQSSPWLTSSTTTTPTWPSSRAARSPSSATAARATPTRCPCATPVSTCASVCPRAPRARPRPRPRACSVLTPAEAGAEADLIMILGAGHRPARALRRVDRAQPEATATRCSSATASTSASARSPRPPASTWRWSRPRAPATSCAVSSQEGRGVPCLVAVEQDASGQRARARPGLRQGHRRHPCRRPQDHLHRGDRDRPVRRAGRALRRRLAPWSRPVSRR